MFFDDMTAILRVLVISVAAYATLILVLRIAGKRSLAKLNAFDLVVTVALGSTLATVLLTKDVALAEGVLAFAMLAGLQYAVALASVHWGWFKRLVRSEPRQLVEDGRFNEAAITAERVTRGEVEQAIRNHGIGRIEEVAAVVLETDGSFSVIPKGVEAELTALRSVKRK
jgi:uncharacterized membrane protein YcaP (DUF421 family)